MAKAEMTRRQAEKKMEQLPLYQQMSYAQSPSERLQQLAALGANALPATVVAELLSSKFARVKALTAVSKSVSSADLLNLWTTGRYWQKPDSKKPSAYKDLCNSLLLNPNTPQKVVLEVVNRIEYIEGSAIVNTPFLNLIIDPIIKLDNERGLVMLARNPKAPVSLLRRLYTLENDAVNTSLAGHVNTPVEILDEIAEGDNREALLAIVQREKADANRIERIFNRAFNSGTLMDIHSYLPAKAFTRNKLTPESVILEMARKGSPRVLGEIYDSREMTPDLADILFSKSAITRNYGTPYDFFDKLFDMPSIPIEVVEKELLKPRAKGTFKARLEGIIRSKRKAEFFDYLAANELNKRYLADAYDVMWLFSGISVEDIHEALLGIENPNILKKRVNELVNSHRADELLEHLGVPDMPKTYVSALYNA